MKITIRRTIIAIGAAALITGAAATPALAAGGPSGNGQVQVGSVVSGQLFVTLSGLNTGFNLNGRAGDGPVTATGAERYSVDSNDSYTLTLSPAGTALVNSVNSSQTIPDANLSVAETSHGGGGNFSGGALNIDGVTNASNTEQTLAYVEDWTLQLPAATPAGSYFQNFSYLALGS